MMSNTQPTQVEHRRAPRISINRSAKLAIDDKEMPVKLLDISLCGTGILCNEEINIDQEVMVLFSLPNYDSETSLSIKGKVVRTASVQRQYLVGIDFHKLDLHQNLIIKGFVSYHDRFANR